MKPILAQELAEIEELIERLRRGEWDRTQFRARGVHYGLYTQRQPDLYFVRMRLRQGTISVAQLNALATAIECFARGACHFTTRQGVEIHDVALDKISPLLRTLAEADLSSHETGGSSVRGVMVCPHAGVRENEPFDATPYAAWLTECLLRHPDFQALPRKMKIGFSCCADDCTHTAWQDLGFQARVHATGERGFRVLAGGGTGALPRLAQELFEFIPAADAAIVTEAFLRVFNRLGDREHRQRARVKFLLQKIGVQALRDEVNKELKALCDEKRVYPAIPVASEGPMVLRNDGNGRDGDDEVRRWTRTATERQNQDGFSTVRVSLRGGAMTAVQLRLLAGLAQQFASSIRVTPEQGFLFRFVRTADLPAIHSALALAGLMHPLAVTRLVACPGSSGCSNAFTHAPGLADALTAQLVKLGHAETIGQLRIRMSGCPNGCGMHASADVGLEGIAHRSGDHWFPAYRIWIGARESEMSPRVGTDIGTVLARWVPECVSELLTHFIQCRADGEAFSNFVDRTGVQAFTAILGRFTFMNGSGDKDWLMTDWGETAPYRPRHAKAAGVC